VTALVLVAGLGNEYRSDDGAGPAVATYVAQRAPPLVDVRVIGDPLELLGKWDDAELAVVVDAIHSGEPPGTVQLIDLGDGEDVDSYGESISTHGMELARVVRLAWAIGSGPGRIVVVGIEGKNFKDGDTLSTAVAEAVPEAGELILGLISE